MLGPLLGPLLGSLLLVGPLLVLVQAQVTTAPGSEDLNTTTQGQGVFNESTGKVHRDNCDFVCVFCMITNDHATQNLVLRIYWVNSSYFYNSFIVKTISFWLRLFIQYYLDNCFYFTESKENYFVNI